MAISKALTALQNIVGWIQHYLGAYDIIIDVIDYAPTFAVTDYEPTFAAIDYAPDFDIIDYEPTFAVTDYEPEISVERGM
jgi:hypothetical protein